MGPGAFAVLGLRNGHHSARYTARSNLAARYDGLGQLYTI